MFSRAEGPFGGISMDGAIFPAFVNLYGAGDDLVLGTDAGPLILYRRDGTRFLRVQGVDDPFAELDVSNPRSSAPAFADVDDDGDYDLLVGASEGTLQYWRNDGNSSHPKFVRVDGADDPFDGIRKAVLTNSRPTFADLDGLALVRRRCGGAQIGVAIGNNSAAAGGIRSKHDDLSRMFPEASLC